VTALCEEYPFAVPVTLADNRGFSAPVNIAARRSSADVIVLVNDDCVCDAGFADAIAASIDPAAGIVMAAGVMRDMEDPGLIDTAGMQLDPTLLVYDYLNGMPIEALAGAPDPIGPSAAAAAFDRESFLRVGGFDENLFAYWEDVDLVLRLLAEGGRCRLARDARGTHEHSATLGSGSAAKNRLMGFGRGYVLRKWRVVTPRTAAAVLARESVILGGQALIDHNLTGLPSRLKGWRAAKPGHRFPDVVLEQGGGDTLSTTLRRRLARRKRLRGS
jgi:hypothetical protein